MFKVGDKVIEKETRDIGTITRRATEDCECCWYVLWETGSESGKELWLPEDAMEIFNTEQTGTDALKAKIEELEAKVEALQKELEISNRFYEVVKKERDYYINLCSRDKPESTSSYTGLAGY